MLRTIEEEVAETNKALSKSTASSSDAPSSDHVCLVMFNSVHDLNEATCYGFKLLTDSDIEHLTQQRHCSSTTFLPESFLSDAETI